MEERKCSVYIHKVPNGKVYVGQTALEPISSWEDGEYYSRLSDKTFYQDINKYGWENITHEVIGTGLSRADAITKKKELCLEYKSYLTECGYNRPIDAGITKAKKVQRKSHNVNLQDEKINGLHIVYAHVVPNGKVYIGQTERSATERWGVNGSGYKKNKRFYKDIQDYGWDNIAHIIICNTLLSHQANYLEKYLIKKYHTTNPEYGYNQHTGGVLYGLEYSLRNKIANLIVIKFFDNNKKVKSSVLYFLNRMAFADLKKAQNNITSNTVNIKESLNKMNFSNNSKKIAYLFAMIQDCI